MSLAYGKPHTLWHHRKDLTGGMSHHEPLRTKRRRNLLTIFTILTAIAALVAVLSVIGGGRFFSGDDVPTETTVVSDVPAVSNLDPALRAALGRASTEASRAGITLYITSGWRSADCQSKLLQEAVATYGSKEEASRWVATAKTSAHVSGEAVDIGSWDASAWLATHGAKYGLCQIYDNEAWHFELRSDAPVEGCPATYFDPTYDPRMK